MAVAIGQATMHKKLFQSGFTLVEIAVALAVMALVVGLGIQLLSSVTDRNQIAATNNQFDAITQALVDFVGRNSRLPCPAVATLPSNDPNYGVENSASSCSGTIRSPSGSPTTAIGIVPWVTLGLSQDKVVDGYRNFITYLVTISETSRDINSITYMDGAITAHSATPISLGLAKASTTQNQINACSITPSDDGCRLAAVVGLVSHGKNGAGAFTQFGSRLPLPDATASPEERENANDDTALVLAGPTLRSTFDDMVVVLSPNDILGPLAKRGIVQSPRAVTLARMQLLKSALLSSLIQDASHRLPYADSGVDGAPNNPTGSGTFTLTYPVLPAVYCPTNVPASGAIPYNATTSPTLVLPSYVRLDGWGAAFRYQLYSSLGSPGLTSTTTGTNIGFRIWSAGPDGAFTTSCASGPPDDIWIDVLTHEIRGFLTSNYVNY